MIPSIPDFKNLPSRDEGIGQPEPPTRVPTSLVLSVNTADDGEASWIVVVSVPASTVDMVPGSPAALCPFVARAGWATGNRECYLLDMARDARDLHRLAQELAALTPEERARVLNEATKREALRPPPSNFVPPLLTGGGRWVGGDLRREDLYGDDGR